MLIRPFLGFQRDAIIPVNRPSGFYDDGGTSTQPASWLVNFGAGAGPTTAGVKIDEWIAEGMPAVYACVHAISETVGQLPGPRLRRCDPCPAASSTCRRVWSQFFPGEASKKMRRPSLDQHGLPQ